MTPEGRIKRDIKKLLGSYGSRIYHHWPVQTGYGAVTLDCLACVDGIFITIEAKPLGGKPTPRQTEIMRRIDDAGGAVFVVDGEDSLWRLKTAIDRWLEEGR